MRSKYARQARLLRLHRNFARKQKDAPELPLYGTFACAALLKKTKIIENYDIGEADIYFDSISNNCVRCAVYDRCMLYDHILLTEEQEN